MTAPFDLTGHVAVVTGGGSGIGLGFARGLAAAGADVAILGRSTERLAAAEAELATYGHRVLALPCDVADEPAVSTAMSRVVDELGGLDSCFANAAVSHGRTGLLDTSLANFRAVTSVNLDGTFLTLREAARHMVASGRGGSLVAVSSLGARFGMAGQVAYAASKGALLSVTSTLAVELARHRIRVNAALPGFVDTEMTHADLHTDIATQHVLGRVPQRRWGEPDDFGGVAVYLASDASRFQTGDALTLDGGFGVF